MCGIAGFIGKGSKDDLLNMMSRLHHRGPDDEGTHIDEDVYLGHKRLSIIDLSENARQPMSNEDKSIWLVFNGEIYNFKELRKSLIDKGHKFTSHTDSEAIIHLYEDCGMDVFSRLNGMFAFALWDKVKKKLYLARDRMGQKPVYYTKNKNSFIFASEVKSILEHPGINQKLNVSSLAKFLFYEHVPTPDCIWHGVSQLNPSSYLEYDLSSQSLNVNKYHKLSYLPRLDLKEDEYLEVLEEKLINSIKRHLIADVPVGVYLSGGMDSTTILYYAQKILKGQLKTFTVAFKESGFDEQYRARESSDLLKTDHHEIWFDSDDFLNTTFEVIPKLDIPFADSSLIPAYYLNKFARNNIKVALGGEGGDEIFVGYPIYRAHELLKYLKIIPKKLREKAFYPFINRIPSSYKNETWEYKLKKFIEAEGYLDNPYYCQQIWLGAFGPEHLRRLFKKEFHDEVNINNLFDNIDLYRQDADEGEELTDGLMRQTQAKYLMDDGLTKSDRASMYNSLEVRAPLLDGELVDWVNKVPFNSKFRRGKTKIILKKLMQGKIPDDIIYGPKRGFTPPIAQWFTTCFREKIEDYIFLDDGLFNQDYIRRLWDEHILQRQNHRKLLWTLFVWKLWSSKNIK